MEETLELYEVQHSDLISLSSDQKTATMEEPQRLEIVSKSIMQNLGRDGPGLLSIVGVPNAQILARKLLPLARKLALLNNDERKKILKDHNLGSDVSLKNLDRIVSSFATQLKYDQDSNFKPKCEEKLSAGINGGGEFEDLGFVFRELGFCMMQLGLSLARACDKSIGGRELEQSLIQSGSAKGRLIHYHSVSDNTAIKQAANKKNQAKTGNLNLWQQWHYDYGIFTMLTSPMFIQSSGKTEQECESPNGHSYLQIFHPDTKRVLKVKASVGSFLVQVGESADVISKGALRATLHSVCRPVGMEDLSRETFVVFLQPAWNKIFSLSEYEYPNPPFGNRDSESCDEEDKALISAEIVPPLFSRLSSRRLEEIETSD
ncbi:2-oxoglutarate (2OG) and Fe(II)-dependent oxygenase superfamily protein [Striga hermonthica]|uniref:2-oxoglutarate (2OG) and Fe(II)-dependent oxygenase superfamily protein n=1 Tax=Striga hermonthica TaxID=68872 RepID=A0A9N7NLG1_STRHE|nr:2-oxoglutarate (2OG) and Fe(II)-dependent oxygenase superfamily protein [Striga hermonthica]